MRSFLSQDIHERFHGACAATHLPHPGALKLLLLLGAGDPPSQRTVAELLECDASYVTALVDSLEAPGYVERRAAPTDRRVKLIALTAEGEAAQAKAIDVLSEPPASFARLTAAETKQLARLLEKAIDLPVR